MNHSENDIQHFFYISRMHDLLQAFEDSDQELDFSAIIRIESCLQALNSGFSMSGIVQQIVWHLEKYLIERVLELTNWNKAETARILQINYKTLYRKINRYFGE